jgi:hypothetical protein
MKHAYLIVIVAVVLGMALAVLAGPSVMASDRDGPKVFDRDSVVYGRTFGEWAAEWNQWSYSIPVAQHPLFDNGDCGVGQSGPVWFLGGKFCANGATCSYTAVRSCSVPAGKALFFPVVDFEDSALEESVYEHPGDPKYQQIGTLRSVTSSVEGATDIFCQIDGKRVRQLAQRFSVQSAAFGFTIPDDNLLKAVYPPPNNFQAGTYFPAVDDGYYLMFALPPGNHVLHFGASWLDITYNLTVAK